MTRPESCTTLSKGGTSRGWTHREVRLTRPELTVPLAPTPRHEAGNVPVRRFALALRLCSCERRDQSAGREPVSVLLLRLTLVSRVLSAHVPGIDPDFAHIRSSANPLGTTGMAWARESP